MEIQGAFAPHSAGAGAVFASHSRKVGGRNRAPLLLDLVMGPAPPQRTSNVDEKPLMNEQRTVHDESPGPRTSSAVSRVGRFVRRTVLGRKGRPEPSAPYHMVKRTDSPHRWELIEPHLKPEDHTALDIGSASGFFTAKLADRGMFAIGLEVRNDRVESAVRSWGTRPGLAFMRWSLEPENIAWLPEVDVVLLLTVYHHWCNTFGRPEAEEMLRELGRKTNRLIFEPPGRHDAKFPAVCDSPISADEGIDEYYTSLILRIFDDQVDVTYLGEAEYPSSRYRTDPLFLIDCRAYGSR